MEEIYRDLCAGIRIAGYKSQDSFYEGCDSSVNRNHTIGVKSFLS
jgi:hypothetical protein